MDTRLCVIANGASRLLFVSLLFVDRSVHLVQCLRCCPCSIGGLEVLVLQKKLNSPIGVQPVESEKFTAKDIRARTDKFACFFRR